MSVFDKGGRRGEAREKEETGEIKREDPEAAETDHEENEGYKPPKAPGGPENVFQKTDLIINIEYCPKICFVTQQNAVDIIRSVSVLNNSQFDMADVSLKISSVPEFFGAVYLDAATLQPGEEHFFKGAAAVPDFDFLSGLSERVKADIVIEAEVSGKPVKTEVKKADVLAFDEWPGYGVNPELLASFCVPRDPAVEKIISKAAQLLKEEGLQFDGYQSGDPNVVSRQLAAIFSAAKSENIAYCMPPASFESGQKIRLPQAILSLGLGTCLDTTMLLCACAEAAGLNPLVFIYSGHAFPAFWLTENTFLECVNDDISEVRKRMASGLSQISALESTQLTDKKGSCAGAELAARERITDGAGFMMYIDIARCRKAGILPLPLRYDADGRYFVDREKYEARREETETKRVSDADTAGQAFSGRLEKWKRDLLDITLRNPLINYKINKAGVPLLNFDLEALEDALSSGRSLEIGAHPKELKKQITDITRLSAENDKQLSEILKNELDAGRVRSCYSEDELSKRLTVVYRAHNLSLEENGASTLYIALGFLRWQEKDKAGTDRFAPVLLLPVSLTRRSAGKGYSLTMSGEEIQVNLSLLEMLRVNFRIDASALKTLPEGEKGVDMTAALTVLRKLVISQKGWDVIEASSVGLFQFSGFVLWNDLNVRCDELKSHPLTGSLISGKNDPRLYTAPCGAGDRLYLPLDSDSSQTAAVSDAACGRTFVLHGPPGTGKSQTITNIIGDALAKGRRVLFVAEKQAALSVVKKRLEKLGLFDFCLELHSNKGQKKNFYEQFDRVLELAENAKDVNFGEAAEKLDAAEKELFDFNKAMHELREAGVSVYGGIEKYIAAAEPSGEPYAVSQTGITGKQYAAGIDALKSLTDIGAAMGEPVNAAFYGAEVKEYGFGLRDEVISLSRGIVAAYAGFASAAAAAAEIINEKKRKYDLSKYGTATGVFETLGDALYYAGKSGFSRFMSSVFSARYRRMRKRPYCRKLQKLTAGNIDDARLLYGGMKAFIEPAQKLDAVLMTRGALEAAGDWGMETYAAAERYLGGISSLKDYCIYNEIRETCAKLPQLSEIAAMYHTGKTDSGDASGLFIKSFWQSWVTDAVSADPVLSRFSQNEYATKRDRFKAFTEYVAGLTKQEIYLKMAANLPNFKFASMSSSEPGILLKAVKSRGRGITIRRLFEKIPALIAKVKPCMLMSPLSAAQYLPKDFPQFDIAVFDEASQLLTAEAAGAASRGNSVIMVGDPNQLPPTTFFKAKSDDTGLDFEDKDLESILDDMLTLNIPERRLLWHYRSCHESLIAFSNANYYDNKLTTFPSPDDITSRVIFKKVDGVYDRSGTRTNKKEAEAVVEELFSCLKDAEKSKLSYGIVTFNITQQTLIEDMIDKRLAAEPSLEKYFTAAENPVFVKNIESVQGDERDVIIFSITYGLDKEGKMTVNFGPVNKEGGWRRLNVAVTRACKKIIVFSTITPDAIDLSRTSAKGVKGLKDFMSYAINCRAYFRRIGAGASDSPLAVSVAGALTGAGYTVSPGVGRSCNKVDIAVSDDSGAYVLGIILDGPDPGQGASVRDREYGREGVFYRMGWRLTRVYALEWWQDPEGELKRLKGILEGDGDKAAAAAGSAAEAEILENHKEIAFNPNIPLPVKEYVSADLPQNTPDAFYLYNNAAVIMRQISLIIEQEAPLTEAMLYKRIAGAWGITRMTQKFTEYAGQLFKRVNPAYNMTQNVKFLWRQKADADLMDYFRDNGIAARRAEDICKEEYAAAAHYILKNALSIGADDLIRETAKLFGFIKSPSAAMRIGYALSLLAVQGRIMRDGDGYKLK